MATARLKAKLTLDNKQYKAGLKQSATATQKFSNSVAMMGKAIAAAYAVKVVYDFAKASMKLYDIQAKAEAKLLTALKGRKREQQNLITQAEELQKITLFGDEATIEAQAMLASLGLNADAIERLTPLVQDLATKANMSLVTAADLVAKSVGSSTNALSRYGVTIEGAVGSAERLESAIEALNKQVGGQAVAAAEAGTGAITQMGNAFGDLQESLGGWIADPVFIAGIKALTDFMTTGNEMSLGSAWLKFFEKFSFGVFILKQNYDFLKEFFGWHSQEELKRYADAIAEVGDAALKAFKVLGQAEQYLGKPGPWAPGFDPDAKVPKWKKAKPITSLKKYGPDPPKYDFVDFNTIMHDMATTLITTDGLLVGIGETAQFTEEQLANMAPSDEDIEQLDKYNFALTNMGQTMNNLATGAVAGLAAQTANLAAELGTLAVTGQFDGDAMLRSFGGFLQQMGGQMAVYGGLVLAFGETQAAFMSDPTPYGKIAEGAALLALGLLVSAAGGAISAMGGGSISTPTGGSGSYSAGGMTPGGGYDWDREIVLVARGPDLVATIDYNRAKNYNNG